MRWMGAYQILGISLMSKSDETGSKSSENKSRPVRPTVSNHDIPKVVSVDRQTEMTDADAFNFADVPATSSSSGNRKTGAGRRSTASSGTRSVAGQRGRGRGKSKKEFELMVAYGAIGAFVLVAVIGLIAMLAGGDSGSSSKSQNNRRSDVTTNDRNRPFSMQTSAEMQDAIKRRKQFNARGDVAFPDADDGGPAATENSSSGDFQLPLPQDGSSSTGVKNSSLE